MGGFSLWVDPTGMLTFTYSMLGVEEYKTVATKPLPSGSYVAKMVFASDEPKPGSGGTVSLFAGDEKIGEGRIDRTVPIAFSSYAGMDVGRDNGLVVDKEYKAKAPYAFTGTVKKVTFDLKPESIDAELQLHEHGAVQALGGGAAG
jgi:arylsulfatase